MVSILANLGPREHGLERAKELAHCAPKGMRNCRIVYDNADAAPPRGATFLHRLAALTRLRQGMVDRHLRDERWVLWVDADLVDYPVQLMKNTDLW